MQKQNLCKLFYVGNMGFFFQVARFGNEAASSTGTVEDSAREVPTGPDPLHHNNHPIGH